MFPCRCERWFFIFVYLLNDVSYIHLHIFHIVQMLRNRSQFRRVGLNVCFAFVCIPKQNLLRIKHTFFCQQQLNNFLQIFPNGGLS